MLNIFRNIKKGILVLTIGLLLNNFYNCNDIFLNATGQPAKIIELKNKENLISFNEQNLRRFKINKNDLTYFSIMINNRTKMIKKRNIIGDNLYDILKNSGNMDFANISFIGVYMIPQSVNTYSGFNFDKINNSVALINTNVVGNMQPKSSSKLRELVNKYHNNVFNLQAKQSNNKFGQMTILRKNANSSYTIATASHVVDEKSFLPQWYANFFMRGGNKVQIKSITNIKKRHDFSYADITFTHDLGFSVENINVKLHEKRNIPMYTMHSVTHSGNSEIAEIEAAYYFGTLSQDNRFDGIWMDLTWSSMHTYLGVSGSAIFNENGELLSVLSAEDDHLFNPEMFGNRKSQFGMLSRPNTLPNIINNNQSNLNTQINSQQIKSINNSNHKKGWGHNNNGKWIWFTGVGQELYNKPGWQKWKGSWLFEQYNKTYATNEWKQVNGKWYHFDYNGYINRGWKHIGNHWYHFTWSGKMDTKGWHKISGKWYYMNKGGNLYTKFGWWKSKKGKWMYSKGANGYATNEKIGKYNFDSNGYLL